MYAGWKWCWPSRGRVCCSSGSHTCPIRKGNCRAIRAWGKQLKPPLCALFCLLKSVRIDGRGKKMVSAFSLSGEESSHLQLFMKHSQNSGKSPPLCQIPAFTLPVPKPSAWCCSAPVFYLRHANKFQNSKFGGSSHSEDCIDPLWEALARLWFVPEKQSHH